MGLKDIQKNKQASQLTQSCLERIMTSWGNDVLDILQVNLRVQGNFVKDQATIAVGNHLSYLDIPILLSQTAMQFVVKKEIAQWPIFGAACRDTRMIFVDRGSKQSRSQVIETIRAKIQSEENIPIVIFPSGTTTLLEEKPWRKGAFEIAKEMNIPIQPFRLHYKPARKAAYIDDDFFPTHLWKLMGHDSPIEAQLELAPLTWVNDPEEASRTWKSWTQILSK